MLIRDTTFLSLRGTNFLSLEAQRNTISITRTTRVALASLEFGTRSWVQMLLTKLGRQSRSVHEPSYCCFLSLFWKHGSNVAIQSSEISEPKAGQERLILLHSHHNLGCARHP